MPPGGEERCAFFSLLDMLLGPVFPDQDVGLCEEFLGKIIDIPFGVYDFLDSGIDEDLGAHGTGICGRVDHGILHTHSEIGRLDDRILLGVDASAEFVPSARWYIHLFADASHRLAVLGSLGGSVVSCGEHPLVLDENRTHMSSYTGGPGRYEFGHFHEIFVVIRTIHDTETMCHIIRLMFDDDSAKRYKLNWTFEES